MCVGGGIVLSGHRCGSPCQPRTSFILSVRQRERPSSGKVLRYVRGAVETIHGSGCAERMCANAEKQRATRFGTNSGQLRHHHGQKKSVVVSSRWRGTSASRLGRGKGCCRVVTSESLTRAWSETLHPGEDKPLSNLGLE
jgi:hypothetical protein